MLKSQIHKPVEIKISTVVAVSAMLRESNMAILGSALKEMTGGMEDFFDNEFAILDLGALGNKDEAMDWPGLIALFKSYRLNIVAVRNAPPEMVEQIIENGLSIDGTAKPHQAEAQAKGVLPQEPALAAPLAQAPLAATHVPAMIIDTPVRAGQRIYARGADLIITAVVNNGAEIIADGSIHIYAPLRGRALAGASGNAAARIFALSMEPELVSIAGVYRTFEDGFPSELSQRPAQIRLVGDRLDILSANPGARP